MRPGTAKMRRARTCPVAYMLTSDVPSGRPAILRRRGASFAQPALAAALLGSAALLAVATGTRSPSRPAPVPVAATGPAGPAVAAFSALDGLILDPRPVMDTLARAAWPTAPLPAGLQFAVPTLPATNLAASAPLPAPVSARAAGPLRGAAIPLPVSRPAELRDPAPVVATRPRRTRQAAAAAEPEDGRSFIEKLFGIAPAYAALDAGPVASVPAPSLSPSPGPSAEAGIAVYDISARAVTLPNGERLEAHSGLGEKLDDPRHVHLPMRGATPPGTYDLAERETPFHGVRALRLNPVGGSSAVFGRAGLLAHTFMLGPNGQSNGCVSVRDYERFLQAYLRGEIRRLVVVAGHGQDGAPAAPRMGASRTNDPPRG